MSDKSHLRHVLVRDHLHGLIVQEPTGNQMLVQPKELRGELDAQRTLAREENKSLHVEDRTEKQILVRVLRTGKRAP